MSIGTEILNGIGQGNGAGPAFWLSNLIVMFFVLDSLCKGMNFMSPNGKKHHKSTGLGYVDDVTLGCTADCLTDNNDEIGQVSEQEELNVTKSIINMGQKWENMLHTNGGLLELKKCYWILIAWTWVRGVAKLKTIDQQPIQMKIKQSGKDEIVIITRKEVNESPRVLGCHVAADGKWSGEFGIWKMESVRFAHKVKMALFNRTSGCKVYPSLWISKLRYIASAVCFTKKQSVAINSPVVAICLPASGYNRNFPRRVVFGPTRFGGLGWETCHSLQILEKIKFILTHLRREDKIGNLIKLLVEVVQVQAGISEPVLNTKHKWATWVETTWLTNVREGLDEIGGGLVIKVDSPKPPRQFDRALMEIFSQWKVSKEEMKSINRVRIYLKVYFVSDISNFEGTEVLPQILEVRKGRESVWNWSRQVRPPKSDRNVWKKNVEKLCINNLSLITTLGRWKRSTHQIWPFMKNMDENTILRDRDGQQVRLRGIGNNRYLKYGMRNVEGKEQGIPVKCATIAMGYKEVETNSSYIVRVHRSKFFEIKDISLRRTAGYIECTNKRLLEEAWKRGDSWTFGTDGGLKGGIGTGGVTLYNNTFEKEVCISKSAEECSLNSLHSTREEMRAMLVAEIIIMLCNEEFGEVRQKIEFVCDSKGALGKLEKCVDKNKGMYPLDPEGEILMEVDRLRGMSDNISREFTWVRSHQKHKDLSKKELINKRADELATESRQDAQDGILKVEKKQIYNGAVATLLIESNVVSKDWKQNISRALYESELFDYYVEKYGWTEDIYKEIHWTAFGSSLEGLYGLHKVTVYKLIHFWQPTNSYVQRNNKRDRSDALCTECGQPDEQLHYMRCKSQFFTDARTYAWKTFCTEMNKYKKEETLLRIIWIGIQNWIYEDFDEELPKGDEISDTSYAKLCEAYHHQSLIGWKHLLVGRISIKWSQFYLEKLDNDEYAEGKTEAFGRDLVKSLWKYTLAVWTSHNEAVHGKNKKYSDREVRCLQECITDIYDNFKSRVSQEEEWLFREGARIRLDKPVPQMIAWLERVLLCFEGVSEADEVVRKAKHVLHRMCIGSIYE